MMSRKVMRMVAILLGVTVVAVSGPYLRFPPIHPEDLLSHSVCELPPESEVGMFRMPIAEGGYRLEFRKWHYYEIVFLVEMKEKEDTCKDRIVGALELPSHGSEEAINFWCARKNGRLKAGEAFIGIVPDGRGRCQAMPAWRVDLARRVFDLVDDAVVECGGDGEP